MRSYDSQKAILVSLRLRQTFGSTGLLGGVDSAEWADNPGDLTAVRT